MPNKTEGVVLYTIEKDGCLNGLYSNKDVKHRVYNEIARKEEGSDINTIEGKYACSWIDTENEENKIVNGTLTINKNNKFYEVRWFREGEGQEAFMGQGFLLKDNTLVVYYTSAS